MVHIKKKKRKEILKKKKKNYTKERGVQVFTQTHQLMDKGAWQAQPVGSQKSQAWFKD